MTSTADQVYQSLAGTVESAEPASATDMPNSKPGPAPLRNPPLAAARSQNRSGPSSSATSPLSSRDASPARPHARPAAASGTNSRTGVRSRITSADPSPSRGPSLVGPSTTTPSAAAIKRALSASNVPEVPSASASSDMAKAPRPLKSTSASNSGDSTPRWPISPRLRSPPPSGEDGRSRSRTNSLRSQIRKPEASTTPAIVVQSSSPAPASRLPVREDPVSSDPDEPSLSMKVSPRSGGAGTSKLETVQESSLPNTPGFDGLETQSFISSTTNKSSDEESNDLGSSSKVSEDLSSKQSSSNQSSTINNESGSDGATKSNGKQKARSQRASSTSRSNTLSSKASISSLSNRYRAEPPLRNMTVETETVPSVAQTGMGNQDRSASGRVDSSLRLKPSTETIRPRKDRKPPKRKAPSIHSGTGRLQHVSYYCTPSPTDSGSQSHTASSLGSTVSHRSYDDRRSIVTLSRSSSDMPSSKADVFEQKVASAVDEANSSDSDATFIYESNPAEQHAHRVRNHHHSRTPSMTSVSSMADPRLGMRDNKNPNKKSSMKFTNPYSNPSIDGDMLDRGDGTIRGGSGRAGYHHIGRHGQGRGALTHLVPDSDSSIAQSSRVRGPSPRQSSQPNSPRFHTFNVGNGHHHHGDSGSKRSEYSAYDMDGENVADDEQTPLLSSGRNGRARTPRRRNSLILRELERRHRNTGGWCRRFAGCLVLSILLLVVIFSSAGLIFATTKPLTSLSVREIQNVVASQEEIMMDLIVDAVNPNIIGVTVSDMDVIIFAKSKHVGSDKWWREHGNGPTDNKENPVIIEVPANDGKAAVSLSGIDEGTDPVEAEPRTMTLGNIFNFDSPLNFDGSFFQRHRAESIGEIRLSHPGNNTEAGGTERWEEVLQYPFELIVRGNFKYTLPLSTRVHKVPITAQYYYDPELEKKNFKKAQRAKEKQDRKDPLYPVPSSPTGRYDRRTLSLLQS